MISYIGSDIITHANHNRKSPQLARIYAMIGVEIASVTYSLVPMASQRCFINSSCVLYNILTYTLLTVR